MEYPGIHFCREYARSGNRLWVTLDTKLQLVPNDREAAMNGSMLDGQSFVTFMGYYAHRGFKGSQYNSYITDYKAMRKRFMGAGLVGDAAIWEISRGFSDIVYFKPAIALLTLRSTCWGTRFDYAPPIHSKLGLQTPATGGLLQIRGNQRRTTGLVLAKLVLPG